MMLSCKEVTRIVSRGLDRNLSFSERVRLRVHFGICEGCTNFNKQMAFLRQAMSRLADHSPKS
jgi:hypothetical protein